MFHEVRILDSEGKVKKIVPGKKLSKKYWHSFFNKVKKKVTTSPVKGKVRKIKAPGKAIFDDDEFSLGK